jgi:uracil-DNA glycosylase
MNKIKKELFGIPIGDVLKMKACCKCKLSEYRRNVVIGRGDNTQTPYKLDRQTDILFIGEAPGKSEDLLGFPFVGESGRLLDNMISKANHLLFEEDFKEDRLFPSYYITNTVLCRPTDEKFGDNRQPTPLEVLQCSSNVINVYKHITPKLVVFVGKVSEKFYKKEFKRAKSIQHPAYILRNGGVNSAIYLDNVRKLMEIFRTI